MRSPSSLAVLALFALTVAQGSLMVMSAQAPAQGTLEFRLQPERVVSGVPQAFSFWLVNTTDHDVRVPNPRVACEDSFDGDIELRLRFIPVKPGPVDEGRGCAHDREDWPPIMDRIKQWNIVRSGEALILHADRAQLFYDDRRAGTYEFWAVYSPPSVDAADQRTLKESGIDFPRDTLRTRRASFLKED